MVMDERVTGSHPLLMEATVIKLPMTAVNLVIIKVIRIAGLAVENFEDVSRVTANISAAIKEPIKTF